MLLSFCVCSVTASLTVYNHSIGAVCGEILKTGWAKDGCMEDERCLNDSDRLWQVPTSCAVKVGTAH